MKNKTDLCLIKARGMRFGLQANVSAPLVKIKNKLFNVAITATYASMSKHIE